MGLKAAIAALILAIGAIFAFGAQSAHAAGLPIQYSTDGVTWQNPPLASVYPSGYVIVPGGSQSSTIYLRTTTASASALTVAVRDVTTDNAQFASHLTLSSTSSSGPGLAATAFSSIPNCTIVAPRAVVNPGQVVSLTITTALSNALINQNATVSNAAFSLVVGLSDPAVNVGIGGCPSGGAIIPSTPGGTPGSSPAGGAAGPSVVAMTGSELLYPSLVVAAVALGVGWILVMLGRRRRRTDRTTATA